MISTALSSVLFKLGVALLAALVVDAVPSVPRLGFAFKVAVLFFFALIVEAFSPARARTE